MPIEEFIEIVRALLGNITEEELPDAIIKLFYYKWKNSACDKELSFSLILYYTVLVLRSLVDGAGNLQR